MDGTGYGLGGVGTGWSTIMGKMRQVSVGDQVRPFIVLETTGFGYVQCTHMYYWITYIKYMSKHYKKRFYNLCKTVLFEYYLSAYLIQL